MDSSGISKRRQSKRQSGSSEYHTRRQEILDTAAQIFRQKGYEATSVLDIAQASNLDRATLYYYSGNKTELYQEIVQRAVERNVEIAETIRTSDADPKDKIERFVEQIIGNFRDQYPYTQAYWQEDMARIKTADSEWAVEMAKLGHRFDEAIVAIVTEGQKKGVLSKRGDPRLIAYAIIGLLNSVHRWYKPTEGFTSDYITDVFTGILNNGIAER